MTDHDPRDSGYSGDAADHDTSIAAQLERETEARQNEAPVNTEGCCNHPGKDTCDDNCHPGMPCNPWCCPQDVAAPQPDAEATAGDMADSMEAAREHHRKHGDMDGRACLLSKCAQHYPLAFAVAQAPGLKAEVERLRKQGGEMAQAYRETVIYLEAENADLRARLETVEEKRDAYRTGLESIRDSDHSDYTDNMSDAARHVADGHRCAANTARAVLEAKPQSSGLTPRDRLATVTEALEIRSKEYHNVAGHHSHPDSPLSSYNACQKDSCVSDRAALEAKP